MEGTSSMDVSLSKFQEMVKDFALVIRGGLSEEVVLELMLNKKGEPAWAACVCTHTCKRAPLFRPS